jgi:hypothetical protein
MDCGLEVLLPWIGKGYLYNVAGDPTTSYARELNLLAQSSDIPINLKPSEMRKPMGMVMTMPMLGSV